MTSKGTSLADELFNAQKVTALAARFAAPFEASSYVADVMDRLPGLELKARMDWMAECFVTHLPANFPKAVAAIRAALPAPLDPGLSDDDFGDFIYAPLGEYAVKAGLEDHPDLALDLIEDLTQRFSMEWAIRPFWIRWPEKCQARMDAWVQHDSYHVRRLVSEGTRPKLPWGLGIGQSAGETLKWLDVLHADRTRFVTRSVANHLNDISKTDPDVVVSRLQAWAAQARQSPKELDWITRHTLRGLIKSGHPDALAMLGYDPKAEVSAKLSLTPQTIPVGDTLALKIDLQGPPGLPVMVDYVLQLHRPTGKPGVKVFKLKQSKLDASGQLHLTKSQRLQVGLSSYRLYPGAQKLLVQVNGVIRAEADFEVSA